MQSLEQGQNDTFTPIKAVRKSLMVGRLGMLELLVVYEVLEKINCQETALID